MAANALPVKKNASASLDAPDFDLAATLDSGQVFHFRPDAGGYLGTIGPHPFRIEQRGHTLLFTQGLEARVHHYFALDHDLDAIRASFPANDPILNEAAEYCRGIRILRQPLWECLATFITSAQKQTAHIQQISSALRHRYGTPLALEGLTLHAYPTPDRLAALTEEALRQCGLGYRARYLLETARRVAEGRCDLESLRTLPDEEALRVLTTLPGVGEKVANCVLLFGYGRLARVPVDVWIDRILRTRYFPRRRKVTAGMVREFAAHHFGPFGGYAQQYLFHHGRRTWHRPAIALHPSATAVGHRPSHAH